MKTKRVKFWAFLLVCSFGLLLYRLADIQLFSTEKFGDEQVNLLEQSVKQQSSSINLTSGRGELLDRNGQSLGKSQVKDIVLFPLIQTIGLPQSFKNLLEAETISLTDIETELKEPTYLSEMIGEEIDSDLYNEVKNRKIPGVMAVERSLLADPEIGQHFLGIVRENPNAYYNRYDESPILTDPKPIGISGLQKAFDPFLQSDNSKKLLYQVDGKGNPMLGLNVRYIGEQDPFYPVQLKTTMDLPIQNMAEKVVDNNGLEKGGLVLLDIESREVLAMVSRPSINSESPYQNQSIVNQMLVPFYPGSIFKTVVAAAAIENNTESLNRTYDCNTNLYGDEPSERKLGTLNFQQSFAQSCNNAFGTIGSKLVNANPQIFEEYTEKLGLLGPVGWTGDVFRYSNFKQFPAEKKGRVWGNKYDRNVEKAIRQTSIGQKDVKVTPLAVANMMATIANNGEKQYVRAVTDILYQNNTTMYTFKANKDNSNRIKSDTALRLQGLLEKVVTDGTGRSLDGLGVAGKSGTAETGQKGAYHHWFAGYFPKQNPKYAMVVVDLYQTDTDAQTYPVYKEVVQNINEMNGVSND
ncbi:penicillin-binding transpeptidase domain-containing protein [Aquibacillus sp. 3ASR75-11]|uniref:serine-type D-Ala-D-Ala carboxypeptidase n=1 Tax=Terrihalobacillus insolitus TaxID=2950438 RepID=A0A9X4AMI7_9BACI|nr:penicillin-binding transpeptidase domain-containing protein [Terrihalobacillus insolitus]MDC3413301.1 penicillin-binding transpeptidase domain-containing protein [Terrihalobacillus insolitus]MDC3424884.1 penicillin-binding transpeptidase domain-containing protein [Terrihalobacillus insolitus]